jgi:site-specific DNA-methyltransferase (adenine-specific)/modification methylase
MLMREECIGDCRLILGDCRDVLPTLGPVDAVVTDPPYGIGESAGKAKTRTTGFSPRVKGAYQKDYGDDDWDDQPISDELMQMVRNSGKTQIIFGGNYYALPPTSCWLVWDKLNGDTDFADCELAWTNMKKAVRRIRFLWNGCMRGNGEKRGDHPTQKPVNVMAWCLAQLPPDARTIIDPFMGSGTTGVACVAAGMAFTGIEREERYYDAACRRIEAAYKQPRLFAEPVQKPVQDVLI